MRRVWIICAVIAGLALAVYWPVGSHEFVHFDDPNFVTENPVVQQGLTWESVKWALTTPVVANWHPVTTLSHILDVELFGLNAGAHHLVSVAIHILNSLLLFIWLNRVTGATWRSAIVAALFALHPLRVESVAWVAERKDLLSGLFFMLTLLAYSNYVGGRRSAGRGQRTEVRGQRTEDGRQRSGVNGERSTGRGQRTEDGGLRSGPRTDFWYIVSLVCFALGLMSKPMLVTLPCVLLLLDAWPLERWRIESLSFQSVKPLLAEKIPFFVLTGLFCWLTLATQQQAGAMGMAGSIAMADRFFNAIGGYLGYLSKFFWPESLAVIYPHPGAGYLHADRLPAWQIFAGGMMLLLLTVLGGKQLRNRPWIGVGWCWFLGMLVPVIGLVQVGEQAMADRYTYLPMIGLAIALVWGLGEWRGEHPEKPQQNRRAAQMTGAVMLGILLSLLAWQSHRQVLVWRDTVTLFEHTLKVTADNPSAHFALGVGLERQGKVSQAIAQYIAAVRIAPRHRPANYNLGQIFRKRGEWQLAARHYEAVLQEEPGDMAATLNLASVLPRLERAAEAVNLYEKVLERDPNSIEALNNLAWLMATSPVGEVRNGRRAAVLGKRAVELAGSSQPSMWGTLAAAYAEAGQFVEALAAVEHAIGLAQQQGNAQLAETNRGLAELYRSGKPYREAQ